MDRLYGGVCYAGIDTDPELKYPKVRFLFVNLFDHQQNLTRLCSPRSGCRSRRVLQPAELHRRHFSTLRAAPARRHRQTRRGETVRPGRPDVRRVPRPALRRQVCAVLLCQRYLSTGEFLSLAVSDTSSILTVFTVSSRIAVLLWALLGSHSLAVRARVPQAPRQGGCGPAPGSALSLVLTPATTINIDCSGKDSAICFRERDVDEIEP